MSDAAKPKRRGSTGPSINEAGKQKQTPMADAVQGDAVDRNAPRRTLRKPPRLAASYKTKPLPSVSPADVEEIRKVLAAPYLDVDTIRLAIGNGWTWYQICIKELKDAASPKRLIDSWTKIEDAAEQLMRAAGGFSESARFVESIAKAAAVQKKILNSEVAKRALISKEQRPEIRQACTHIAWNLYDAQLKELGRRGDGHGFLLPTVRRAQDATRIALKALGINLSASSLARPERFYDLFDFRGDYDATIAERAAKWGWSREELESKAIQGPYVDPFKEWASDFLPITDNDA